MPAQQNPPTILDELKRRSGWSIFMGILTMAAGVALIVYPFAAATATTVFIGAALLVVGGAELYLAFASQSAGSFFPRFLLAALYGLTGVALIVYPFQGAESLTLFVGVMLIVRGVLAMIAGFKLKPIDGWGWFVADSLANLVVGGLILAKWPSSTNWAVGTLLGAAVLMTGIARTAFAVRIRQGAGDVQKAVRQAVSPSPQGTT